ncbi:MAG TPA: hypothetical protein VHA37_04445 [Candidatus Saccharimonadales bacterium]|nr:hypothetical protein [Candidatus Saccharimonadales bacterium]
MPPLTEAGITHVHAAAARAYRRAFRRYKFQAEGRRLADMILFYSHDRERARAVVPAQSFFGLLLGMSKVKVSEGLSWLEANRVMEREAVLVTIQQKEQRWMAYWLCPPGQWRLDRRVQESAALVEVEEWLEGLDVDQLELLPPPPSLSQLLAEDFAERAGFGAIRSRVEAGGLSAGQLSSPGGNSDGVEIVSKASLEASLVVERRGVPPEGTIRVPQEGTAAVPLGGTLAAGKGAPACTPAQAYARAGVRIDPDRIVESIKGSSRSEIDPNARAGSSSPGGNHRAYLEERLFKTIGQEERHGLSGSMWQRALDQIPDDLDELLSYAIEGKRLGRIAKLPRWLNTSTRAALAMALAKGGK